MKNLNLLHHSSLALPSYIHITKGNTGTPFLHVFYKRFSQLFIDDSTNLISLYITSPTVINQPSSPDFVHATIRICLPFRMFKTVF